MPILARQPVDGGAALPVVGVAESRMVGVERDPRVQRVIGDGVQFPDFARKPGHVAMIEHDDVHRLRLQRSDHGFNRRFAAPADAVHVEVEGLPPPGPGLDVRQAHAVPGEGMQRRLKRSGPVSGEFDEQR